MKPRLYISGDKSALPDLAYLSKKYDIIFVQTKPGNEDIPHPITLKLCEYFNVKYENMLLTRKCRKRELVEIRQIAMYFLNHKEHGKLSFQASADQWGLNHATAINGIRHIKNLIETDKYFFEEFLKIEAYLINFGV